MVNVPDKFRPHIKVDYPEGNKLIFEEWFFEEWRKMEGNYDLTISPDVTPVEYNGEEDWHYLPIFWTSYFVNNAYGRNLRAKRDLQQFVYSLDRSKQYFTIIQYDDGPLIKLPSNVKVFAMSGPRIDYPLPLICMPHEYQFDIERDLFCNFVGRLTNPVRKQLLNQLSGKSGYFTTSNILPTKDFCKVLAQSVFTLCPRGHGQTSFRIYEALQYGSIPVYISDQHIIPHNEDFNEYGVLIHSNEVSQVHEILSGISPEEIKRKQENGRKIYNEKFSYQGVKELILNNI